MANWIKHENVKFDSIYKRVGYMTNQYLIKLRIPNKNSIFSDPYEFDVQDSKFKNQLNELKEGKRERCYFSFGMQDIDFYKIGDKFATTHSPHEGLNVQLVFAKNEFEELLQQLNNDN